MLDQKQLYLYNRAQIQACRDTDPTMLAFERQWIETYLRQDESTLTGKGFTDWRAQFHTFMEQEQAEPPDTAVYVAERMSLNEFRILVQEFAVDGLTEAQAFYYILPRLTLEAQMPMLRIMIDEFGSGNLKRAHTTLYVQLLEELGMPTELDAYIERTGNSSFEFVNLFFWLTLRAEDPSYFVGALTYLETAIPTFFECYVDACKRLGIKAHAYYSEHQHIDAFHAQEGLRILRAMERTDTLNAEKAWQGVLLASTITGGAFDTAVEKAVRFGHQSNTARRVGG